MANEKRVLDTIEVTDLEDNSKLTEAARQAPLKGRPRAVRIESVVEVPNRLLAIDGSDLVYRMMLPYNEGFFQDDEVAQAPAGEAVE